MELLDWIDLHFPNSKYVLVPPYVKEKWEGREYNSAEDNKAPLNSFLKAPYNIKQAKGYADLNYRIGWVAPLGVVIVDIDNKDLEGTNLEDAAFTNALFKKEIKPPMFKTSPGVHYVFTDKSKKIPTDKGVRCHLGIPMDYRANDGGYIVLPINDPHRHVLDLPDSVPEIPAWAKPVVKSKQMSFVGMKEGDGRNDALYRWRIAMLNSGKVTEGNILKALDMINTVLFAEPMNDREMQATVMREDVGIKVKKESSGEKYNTYAEQYMTLFPTITVQGQMYTYNGRFYEPTHKDRVHKVIHENIDPNLSKASRDEVENFIKLKTLINKEDLDTDWKRISCANGILNLERGTLEAHSQDNLTILGIPHTFDPDPIESSITIKFMNDLTGGDKAKNDFLYEIMGYCLLKKNLFQKFFVLQGSGGTGRSTFCRLLTTLVGKENVSPLSITDFDKDYQLAKLQDKLLNINDDVDDSKILETSGRFKSVVAGERIACRPIYRDVIELESYAKLFFCTNGLPKISDKSQGLYRRLQLIKLDHKVKDPDRTILEKFTVADYSYLLFKCMEAIHRVLQKGSFSIENSEEKLLTMFRCQQSPLYDWIFQEGLTLGFFRNKEVSICYRAFRDWCDNNGYFKNQSAYAFREELCGIFGYDVDYSESSSSKVFVNNNSERGDLWIPF